jgi:hypothetical protein
MGEAVQIVVGRAKGPSLREIAAALFRHVRLLKISFLLIFAAGMTYAIICPSYEAHMKILVRPGRIDPAMTPTQTVAPLLQQEAISEEELNSQSEFLQDDEVLRKVVSETHLADGSGSRLFSVKTRKNGLRTWFESFRGSWRFLPRVSPRSSPPRTGHQIRV